jgi:hypothetical protein
MSDETPPAENQLDVDTYTALKAEEAGEGGSIEVRDQSFRTVANLPGIVLLDLGVASDPSATTGEQLRAMRQFIHAAIHPEDVAKFEHLLRTANPIIDMDELNTYVEKLMEVITARPTE